MRSANTDRLMPTRWLGHDNLARRQSAGGPLIALDQLSCII
jgi:hypothetical protein